MKGEQLQKPCLITRCLSLCKRTFLKKLLVLQAHTKVFFVNFFKKFYIRMYVAFLSKLSDKKYKYGVKIFSESAHGLTPLKDIKFGAVGYRDYTLNTTDKQKSDYIARHRVNEDWTKTGYLTAGFWSRWILWNKRTVEESINDIHKRSNNIQIFLI